MRTFVFARESIWAGTYTTISSKEVDSDPRVRSTTARNMLISSQIRVATLASRARNAIRLAFIYLKSTTLDSPQVSGF